MDSTNIKSCLMLEKYFKNTLIELIISVLILFEFKVFCLLQPVEISPPPSMPLNVEKIKLEGNEMFKKGQYSEAKDLYAKAIEKLLPSKFCGLFK